MDHLPTPSGIMNLFVSLPILYLSSSHSNLLYLRFVIAFRRSSTAIQWEAPRLQHATLPLCTARDPGAKRKEH